MSGETKIKSAVIFASRPVSAGMRRYVGPGAYVAAADAGWIQANKLGLKVDLAVGDFDSSAPPPDAAELVCLPAEKDDTDTHFAARELLRRGVEAVVLLGALGGRRDHEYANWQTMLYLAGHGVQVMAADDGVELYCMGPGELVLPRGGWRWLSVFAAGGDARGVWLGGLKYPLSDAVLTCDVPIGMSNEFVASEATIRCGEGHSYVLCSVDEPDGKDG